MSPQTANPHRLGARLLDALAMNTKQLMAQVEFVLDEKIVNLTTKQFARVAGVSERTIRQDCASGRLPAYQSAVGTPYLIHFTHLAKYMEVNHAA